jgi:hypothetical protein
MVANYDTPTVRQASYPPDSTEEPGHQRESGGLDEMRFGNSDSVLNPVCAQLTTESAELRILNTRLARSVSSTSVTVAPLTCLISLISIPTNPHPS